MPLSEPNDEEYLLTSLEQSDAPSDMEGDDWYCYTITQGDNEIVGYRRGKLTAIKSELKTLVESLNERRSGKPRGRVHLTHSAKPKKESS